MNFDWKFNNYNKIPMGPPLVPITNFCRPKLMAATSRWIDGWIVNAKYSKKN